LSWHRGSLVKTNSAVNPDPPSKKIKDLVDLDKTRR
jgi:hypothetical protein